MAHPAAVVFALSLAIWVADVRFAPASSHAVPASACQSGLSTETPPGVDAEVVVCGTRVK